MSDFLSSFAAKNAVLPLAVAVYRACKDRHGSKAEIAKRFGFNPMVFSKCIDINNKQYHLRPEHIEAVLQYTKDIRIVESIASAHGGVVLYELPTSFETDVSGFIANVAEVSRHVAELFKSVSDALLDGRIVDVEMAAIEKDAMLLIAAVAQLKKLAKEKCESTGDQNENHF